MGEQKTQRKEGCEESDEYSCAAGRIGPCRSADGLLEQLRRVGHGQDLVDHPEEDGLRLDRKGARAGGQLQDEQQERDKFADVPEVDERSGRRGYTIRTA